MRQPLNLTPCGPLGVVDSRLHALKAGRLCGDGTFSGGRGPRQNFWWRSCWHNDVCRGIHTKVLQRRALHINSHMEGLACYAVSWHIVCPSIGHGSSGNIGWTIGHVSDRRACFPKATRFRRNFGRGSAGLTHHVPRFMLACWTGAWARDRKCSYTYGFVGATGHLRTSLRAHFACPPYPNGCPEGCPATCWPRLCDCMHTRTLVGVHQLTCSPLAAPGEEPTFVSMGRRSFAGRRDLGTQ